MKRKGKDVVVKAGRKVLYKIDQDEQEL